MIWQLHAYCNRLPGLV